MYGILLVVTLVAFECGLAENVIVQTNFGPVKGFTAKSVDGKDANIFLGIPFARPPVDELRFEKPLKPEKWTEPVDATEFKSSCYPNHRSSMSSQDFYSEDCLYLNVMAPAKKAAEKYAVIVWIHGGGYNFGSAKEFNYQNITNNFVSRDVILVSIQYRLGPFGFLSSGDEVLPGNYGMWDQTAALEFVKENIGHFGGDSDRITINGLSAGGGSTSLLTLSPHSQNLFTSSIQMSGSALAEWSSGSLVVNASTELVKELGCDQGDSVAWKKCLKAKTVDDFLDAVNRAGNYRNGLKMLKLIPRVDNDFFPDDPEALIKSSPKKPTIIGVAEKEGILFTLFLLSDVICNLCVPPEDYMNFTREKLINFIKTVATKEDLGEKAKEVQAKIIDFYANPKKAKDSDYNYWLQKYTELVSDVMFNLPALKEADLKLQNDWPMWLYVTDYYSPAIYSENFPVKGATHAYEYAHMFAAFVGGIYEFDDNERKLQSAILDTLTNFAKKSDPSTDSFIWERATKEHPRRNLRFRPKPIMEDKMFEESDRFWKNLENYEYNVITGKTRVKAGLKKLEL